MTPRAGTSGRPHRALVIGRFQPPHDGHLHVLRTAARVADETLVVVGSADQSHTPLNPFTAGERITLLAAAVAEADLPVRHILPIDDLGHYHLWVAHVDAHVPAYDVVVTGSPITARLFADAGYAIETVPPVDRERLRATRIRARIAAGEDVSDVVPDAVAGMLAADWVRERFRTLGE